ncbi:DUF5305 family protein [Halorarum halobium]|uniref:DUF5305 family protein n=1 Tax=Halorarum halobium TaxID=3075121 RepID=UPI0028AEFEBB|nr:DUF5305 family protein [Halobaculum sp. XH14]
MSSSERVDRYLHQYGTAVVVVLLLAGLAGLGGAAVEYTDSSTEQVSEEVDRQQYATSGRTSAVVTGNTTLYEANERLVDMPAYFFAASPNLTVAVETSVPADREVEVTQRLTLRTRAAREGQQFWESRRLLGADSVTVSDGSLRTNATVNMSAVRAALNEKRAAIGTVGTLDTRLVVNVTYESDLYSGSLTAEAPVVLTDRAYWLGSDLSASQPHSRTVTRQVTEPPNLPLAGGLAAAGLVALVLAGAVWNRSQSIDESALGTTVARARFEEWISDGEIPTKTGKEYTRTDSLEDLVDIGIDSGKRVIYDDELDAYAVIEGDVVHYYTTGDEDITDWFDV